MTTIRLIPPPNSSFGQNPMSAHGRTYSCAIGSTIDVPDFDALILKANGWTDAADFGAGVGTTAARPKAALNKGLRYLDSTLNVIIQSDGVTWRNPVTGAAV